MVTTFSPFRSTETDQLLDALDPVARLPIPLSTRAT
jgi:hypothetical protein